MLVSDLRVSLLAEHVWVPVAMVGLWAASLLALAALLVLVFVDVLVALAMPGVWRDALQGWLIKWLGAWVQSTGQGRVADYVHFALFAGLGAVLAVARPDWRWSRLILELLLLAAASEVIQSLA